MGTSTLLDIMGAIMIGGILMLNMMRVYFNTSETSTQYVSEFMVQESLVDFTTMLEYDFRKIGYVKGQENLSHAAQAIKTADKHKLVFYADIDNSGDQEEIEYSVGDSTQLTNTPNIHDVPFFRKVDGSGAGIGSYGIVEFQLEYFDYSGIKLKTPVTNLGAVSTISITVSCESPFYSEVERDLNARAYWKQIRLAIPNLRYK